MKDIIIKKLSEFFSRKLFLLILSTIMLYHGKIDQILWLTVAMAFIGSNIAEKYFESQKKG